MQFFPKTKDFLDNSIRFGEDLVRLADHLRNKNLDLAYFINKSERIVELYLNATFPAFERDINSNLDEVGVEPTNVSDEDKRWYYLLLFDIVARNFEKFFAKREEAESAEPKKREVSDLILGLEKHFVRLADDQNYALKSFVESKMYPQAGFWEYVWHTQLDDRVVGNPFGVHPVGTPQHEDHYHREGKIFRWDMPPSDGHPGQPPGCRCYTRTVVTYDDYF